MSSLSSSHTPHISHNTRNSSAYGDSGDESDSLPFQGFDGRRQNPSDAPSSLLDGLLNSNQGKDTAFYQKLTQQVLFAFYPKRCDSCDCVMTGTISTRPDTVRCTSCYAQKSRLSYTPLHCMRLPYWMFGWVFHESFKRYPQVLTSAEIHRRLDISYKSALKLKRRFQLFCSQQQEAMKVLFKEELVENHYELPPSRKVDLRPILKGKTPPVNIDTLAIFSASQRVNKGRKRNKHGGLTASIYMNDSLGGRQVGSLFQTIAVKNGPVFMQSVPNQKMETLLPILQDYIPPRAPVFSDAGYKWYYS